MATIIWTRTAQADLRTLHAQIARDSKIYAQRMVDRVRRGVERLADFPESGARVPEWNLEEIREIVVKNYRAIYRYQASTVDVLTIIYAARDLSTGSLRFDPR